MFDEFTSIGEHPPTTGMMPPGGLVLHGMSNGGLLVDAVITQRPDLATVTLPDVGVMDVLRFHFLPSTRPGSANTETQTTLMTLKARSHTPGFTKFDLPLIPPRS